MPVQLTAQGKTLYALLSGDIDHHTAPALREQIDSAVTEYRPRLLRLDFSLVGFMDSSGVGLVMGRYRHNAAFGGETEVCGLSRSAERIMKMSGLNKIVSFRKTAEGSEGHGKDQ